jgi:hypothetical protein
MVLGGGACVVADTFFAANSVLSNGPSNALGFLILLIIISGLIAYSGKKLISYAIKYKSPAQNGESDDESMKGK